MSSVTFSEINRMIDALWRIESARIIGTVMRMVRNIELAEDIAQETLLSAVENWPTKGVPDNPGAWLMTVAKNKSVDVIRHQQLAARKQQEILVDSTSDDQHWPDIDAQIDRDIGDDLLRLFFISCHPILSPEARVSLTLRLLGGLTTNEIARAFLVPEATISQRIVRAKRTLNETQVPFEVPTGSELALRLPSVLEAIYLIFNEGYSATRGNELIRYELCEDAMRLGRILSSFLPEEPEVHGLLALMELHSSRSAARVSPIGEPILLADQDRTRWDQLLIHRGLDALARATSLCKNQSKPLGPYAIQASISACHARAHRAELTHWATIVALYDALAEMTQSPVVELNRAVAIGMAYGPSEALELVDELSDDPSLAKYYLLPAVRGDLLEKLERHEQALYEFEKAAQRTENSRERALLLKRAEDCKKKAIR